MCVGVGNCEGVTLENGLVEGGQEEDDVSLVCQCTVGLKFSALHAFRNR